MKIGYFTNQYPAVSHTFIRREIRALETLGVAIVRYALRPGQNLVDKEDLREASDTRFVAQASWREIFIACTNIVSTNPAGLFGILRIAWTMGQKSERGLLRHYAYVLEAIVLARWCRKDGIGHLHAHFGTNSASIAMFTSELTGLPYSFTAHGSEEFEKAPLLSLNKKLAKAAFAVCVSSFGRSQLMRWSRPEHWSKIFVVHCGLDRAFFDRPLAALPRSRRLVCVGRLDEHKAQIVLIEAARLLHNDGVEIDIALVGDGEWRSAVERAIASARLQQRVRITGWVDGEAVKSYIEEARVLVLPSFSENMPVVIMEALALGRPVVSTYVAGIPEMVRPGESGWLVPAGDVAALARALQEAVGASDAKLDEMGRAGRKYIQESHNSISEAMKLKNLFERKCL